MTPLQLLQHPTRHLFFTGKGGVGKTSLSTACAIALADGGKQVLLVSTDAASNLDEMLGITLANTPVPVPGVPGLSVLNIDPDNAAQSYRARVLAQMDPASTDAERSQVQEQLSGACTTEIAAFDEFANLLSGDAAGFDHVVFDTAPTGHTLRLLSLPKAWTGFLEGNDRGASCLGPHSGLKMQEARFAQALQALPQDQIPLRAFDTVGLPALRALLQAPDGMLPATASAHTPPLDEARTLAALTDALAAPGHGLIMVMGKGGVGKTTVAAAIAAGLVQRRHTVHLSTTDPADHLQVTVDGSLPGLKVDRIDPKAETDKYIAKVMAAWSPR